MLPKVRWYGSNSIAQSSRIIKNFDASDFAMKTNITNPLYSINNETNKVKEFTEVIE